MNLIYSNLLASFANQSKNPKKTLVIRGLLASLGSIVFSLVNLQIARTWRLPQDLPSSLVWLTLVVVVQILVGLVVYIGSHNLKLGSNFNRLAVSWPMPSRSGWLVRNLNLLILAGILLIIIGPSVILSSKYLGLSLIATCLAILVGSLSGLGLGQYQIGRSSLVGSLLSGIVALSEINLISQIIDQTVWTGDNRFLFGCLIILIVSPMAWLNLARTSTSKSKMLINGKYFKLPSWQLIWPINIWLLPKFLRHSQIRKAVSSTAGLSLIIAGGIIINRISFPTAGIFGAIYCCLNCICMTDMRAAIRRHRSPEVMILMGTTYVWWRMIIVGSLAAALATAPLALTMLAAAANSWLILTKLIIGWSFGISLGWLLGTILVPQPGDVSGQFFAAIASIGGVAALDKIISNDHWLNLIIVAALSATLLAGSWIIEINRNNYYWKGNIHV